MRPWLAGLAKKRQVIAAYNQLIGAKRQTFRKKRQNRQKRQKDTVQAEMSCRIKVSGGVPGVNKSGKARMLEADCQELRVVPVLLQRTQ
jgi:hypothetical protein